MAHGLIFSDEEIQKYAFSQPADPEAVRRENLARVQNFDPDSFENIGDPDWKVLQAFSELANAGISLERHYFYLSEKDIPQKDRLFDILALVDERTAPDSKGIPDWIESIALVSLPWAVLASVFWFARRTGSAIADLMADAGDQIKLGKRDYLGTMEAVFTNHGVNKPDRVQSWVEALIHRFYESVGCSSPEDLKRDLGFC